MTQEVKRFHPAWMMFEVVKLMKNSIAIFLFLFVLKFNSTSEWVIWGRYLFLVGIGWTLIMILLKWVFYRYEVVGDSIALKEGIFVKEHRTVSFDKIQNHQTKTTFLHKWLGLTSLTLETGTSLEEAAVYFPVLKADEKERILSRLENKNPETEENTDIKVGQAGRKIHFRSNKRDSLKASFTSLSFLAIFPLLSTIYFNLADFFDVEDTAEGAFDYLLLHWWMLIILFVLAMAISVGIGYLQTTIKYGNYEISDDEARIYIKKGVGSTSSFVIQKEKVQAVVVEQSMIKRLLGLASVKLISVGAMKTEEQETSSLYPFMPKQEAYQLMETLLPQYPIQEKMDRFPIKVLWYKLLVPYYFTIITAIGLFIFKKEWIWIAGIIFAVTLITRILDYFFTSYLRQENTVQIRKGGLTNETFITHYKRIQQVSVEHSWLQRKFGIASLYFQNRANPLHISELHGVSREEASAFFNWFKEKRKRLVHRNKKIS
ncbi:MULTISPECIES: PH domain-containing protein [unclassified Sutcliffiella]|uniref:PH domain-containing protein n=1 Tax=unclassified Sutcliffiella TaxID=2837532 RepID=UPI0030D5617D